MQNLFSMLSRAKAPSQESEEINKLREELNAAKARITNLDMTVVELHGSVSMLTQKVKEISAVLGVQQSMLEELTFGAQPQQKGVVPLFSFGGNDDDDLPN